MPLDDHGATVAFGIRVGEAYVSSDAGGTWDLVEADLSPVQCALPVAERERPALRAGGYHPRRNGGGSHGAST